MGLAFNSDFRFIGLQNILPLSICAQWRGGEFSMNIRLFQLDIVRLVTHVLGLAERVTGTVLLHMSCRTNEQER